MRTKSIGLIIGFSVMLAGCGGGRFVEPLVSPPRLATSKGELLSPNQERIVQTARKLLDAPYRFGGMTPQGFDCSGFVGYVFKKSVGKILPRRAREQMKVRKPISSTELRPADLVYFRIREQNLFHIGIYLGG